MKKTLHTMVFIVMVFILYSCAKSDDSSSGSSEAT